MILCPVCGHGLHEIDNKKEPWVSELLKCARFSDEVIWWCQKCREYVFEEDLLYNTEE